ncbi:hypothetical protein [Cetobacterium sp.]|uniref:hypothetical protein n=1 Tax=Cetobacterium sp. TaxID=2071632 RepID=UPI003EE72F91
MKECLLCNQNRKLMKSHIIPKFVGKYLKNTSVSPYFRHGKVPKKRQQDIIKIPLLCNECELIFSRYEDYFNRYIFMPFCNSKREFKYDENLKKFIVSLNWRVGQYILNEIKDIENEKVLYVRNVLMDFEKYLKGDFLAGEKYDHHIFFLDEVEAGDQREDIRSKIKNINTYYFRTIDCELYLGNENMFIYTKLPGIYIISIIKGEKENLPTTKVLNNGVLKIPQSMEIRNFGTNMLFKLEEFNKLLELSLTQEVEVELEKILKENTKDKMSLEARIKLLDFLNELY